MIKIGIDPDLEKSGLAVVKDGKLVAMHKYAFNDLINQVVAIVKEHGAIVMLEDTEANKPVFWRKLKGTPEHQRKINLTIAQKIGMVKAVTRLIHESLEFNGVTCHKIKPLQGNVKKAKNDAAFFNQITGWEKRSNQDGRDAALIALYGVIKNG